MDANAILARALELGITLEVAADGTSIRALPRGATPPDLGAEIRAHKPELLTILTLPTQVKSVFPEARLIAVRDTSTAVATAVAVKEARDEPADDGKKEDPRAAIDPAVCYELDNWERQLVAMDWPTERIWNHDFWPHRKKSPRGLASVLQRGDRIQFADNNFVHILKRDGSRQRFPKDG
jgi:hypothetical protein